MQYPNRFVFATHSTERVKIFDMQKAIENTILKSTSFQTKALNELTEEFSVSAAEIMLLCKRKADPEEEEEEDSRTTASISSKNRVVTGVFKRARRKASKNSNALRMAFTFIKEIRRLSVVRNKTLRLQALTQFALIRQMTEVNNKAASFLSAAGVSPLVPSAKPKPPRRSSRIAS
ncbi:hypothetical protein BG011_000902 [Mortierella polycephala]|uniref:Uncharacterized protein n=1 Tax=Mortierella polycephala TaxID=41804 RepID=A0A9P6QA71_9FUNG|nr:hypothetical protein BG011_000902 [Mortierella polycephala]